MDSNNTVLIVLRHAERADGEDRAAHGRDPESRGPAVMLVDCGAAPGGRSRWTGWGAVLVGGAVLAGGYSRHVVRFVREHRALLARVPSAFLLGGARGGEPHPRRRAPVTRGRGDVREEDGLAAAAGGADRGGPESTPSTASSPAFVIRRCQGARGARPTRPATTSTPTGPRSIGSRSSSRGAPAARS
jgi:hypothetical protein